MIRATPYVRGTRFDAVLHGIFEEFARLRGFEVPTFDQAPVPQWIEVRMLSLRLDQMAHPFKDDTAWKVLGLGIRAAVFADGLTGLGRILWTLWFGALATLPRRIMLSLVARWRPQSKRPRFIRRLIATTRGVADRGPIERLKTL
jgi:hypothetical protein